MQVKKVFSIDPAPLTQKPPYVKPKYKTYRQLLDLDRPKKIIHEESDDQNDDFLEKIMKKEKRKLLQQKLKDKQKKLSAKSKKQSQLQNPKNNNNQPIGDAHIQIKPQISQKISLEKKRTSKQNSRLPSAKSKPYDLNQSVEYLQKKIQTEEMSPNFSFGLKKQTTQNQHNSQLQVSEEGQSAHHEKRTIKVLVRKKNSSDSNFRRTHNPSSASKFSTFDELHGKMLQQSKSEVTKIIKNNFIPTHKLRKTEGLREIQRNTHLERSTAKNYDNLIETKLNPEKKVIQHTISPQKYVKQNQISDSQRAKIFLFKSASSPPVQQMIQFNKSPKRNDQSKYKDAMIARKSLFKSSYQEELFIKSLKKK